MKYLNLKNNDSKMLIREAFITILPAQLLASLIPFLSGIINGLVIGNFYSDNMIAVIGFVTPVVYILSAIRTLISIGGGTTACNYMGQGNLSKVNETYRLCISTIIITGLFLMFIVLVFTGFVAGMVAGDEILLGETENYLRGLSFGFIPSLMIPMLSSFLQLAGSSKKVVISSVLNAFMNLVFDIIAVKAFSSGVMGIGIATSIAQWMSAAYLFISIHRTGFVRYSLAPANIKILENVFRYGINSCMLIIMETIRNSALVKQSYVVGGIEGSSATSVLFAASGLVDFITSGFMSATIMIGGLYAGEENEDALNMTARWGMKAGGIAGLISGGLLFVLSSPVAKVFGAGEQGMDLAVTCLRMYSVYIMLVNPLQIITRIYQCLKRVKVTFIIIFTREIIISLTSIYICGALFGMKGIWLCFPASAIFGSLLVLIISAGMCRVQGREKFSLIWYEERRKFTDFINFYVTEENQLRDVMQDIKSFCERNNMNKRSEITCQLLAEENIMNLLEHGVKYQKKNDLVINVFIGSDSKKTRLVFQDNSDQFDPLKRFKVYDEKSDEFIKDSSIRIIKSLADNISYQFSFGMNILMIDMYDNNYV